MAPKSDETPNRIQLRHERQAQEERARQHEARRMARTRRPIEPWQVTCSPAQAAAAAGVAVSTIWLWINGNKLASRSVGGRRLISVASLYRLIGADRPNGDRGEG